MSFLASFLAVVALATAPAPSPPPPPGPFERLTGVETTCRNIPGREAGDYLEGGGIRLDRRHTCRHIRAFWRDGFPTTPDGVFLLGQAIFVVAHESRHLWQYEHGIAGYLWIHGRVESDADCAAARQFLRWAADVGVDPARARSLQNIIRGHVGYRLAKTDRCWRATDHID